MSAGRPLSACGIAVNVTQSREQERALRFSEEKYRATMDAAQVGVFILQDFKFTYVNPMLVEMFGYRDDELVGKLGPPDVVIPEQHELLIGKMRRRARSRSVLPSIPSCLNVFTAQKNSPSRAI